MGRPLIDRVSDPVRRCVMTSLFYAPSLGALAIAGGLVPAVAISGLFTIYAGYSYMCMKIGMRDLEKDQTLMPAEETLGYRQSAPAKVQRVSARLCRDFGIEKPVRVFLYPDDYPSAFVTGDNQIGFSRKVYKLLNPGELEWVMAHELGHIKRDVGKMSYPMSRVSNYMEILAAGVGGVSAAQAFGYLEFAIGGAAGLTAAFTVAKARRYVDMYSSRSMERRRDYEATQKTGKPVQGMSAIFKIEALLGRHKLTAHQRLLHTHPVERARFMNIITAYHDGVNRGIVPPLSEPAPAI